MRWLLSYGGHEMIITFIEPTVSKMIELPLKWYEKIKWRGGRYYVIIKPSYQWPPILPTEIEEWLNEHTKTQINTYYNNHVKISFRRLDEAAAFKLRWM